MSDTVEFADPSADQAALFARHYIRLRRFLPVIFCLLISVVFLVIILITHRSATRAVESMAEDVMTQASQRVVERSRGYLNAAAHEVRVNAEVWRRGQRGLVEEEQTFLDLFNRTSRAQLDLFPYFGLIYYGDQQGNQWLNKRERDGTAHVRVLTRKEDSPASRQALEKWAQQAEIAGQDRQAIAQGVAPYLETYWYEQNAQGQLVRGEQDPDMIYDPRMRPWYVGAKEQHGLFWTDVYAWKEEYQGVARRQVGITASAPMIRDGQLTGVCGIDISLEALSLFLHEMAIMKNGQAFILNTKGKTVGLPNYQEVLEKVGDSGDIVNLNHISKVTDPVLAASYAALRKELGLVGEQTLTLQERVITFSVADKHYYGYFKPFAAELGLDWVVGVVVPEDDFLGGVKEDMQRSLLLALASVFFAIVAGIIIGRWVTNPLAHLDREVALIMQLNMAPTPPLETRFLEFRMISLAFTRMKLALAEMVEALSVHTNTLDWSSEELTYIATLLENSTKIMQEDIKTVRSSVRQLPDQIATKKEMATAMIRAEESLRVLRHLNEPVIKRVEELNQGTHELRKVLQSVRI